MMDNQKKVSLVLWITLFFNALVSVIKISVGIIANIPSVLADGFHSLSDSFSNVIGIVSIHIAQKPIDEDHAYGHQRYETLATLFIVALLAFLGLEVTISSIQNLLNPQEINPSWVVLLLIIFTFVVNIIVATSENILGKRWRSSFLIADSKHTFSDIYITAGVLINLFIQNYIENIAWLDSVTALLIAVVIFRTAYRIFIQSSLELTDAIAIDPQVIEKIVLRLSLVESVHKIRSRKSGSIVFIDLHVQTNPHMILLEAHQLAHDVEKLLQEELDEQVSVIVHVEPNGYPSK